MVIVTKHYLLLYLLHCIKHSAAHILKKALKCTAPVIILLICIGNHMDENARFGKKLHSKNEAKLILKT